MTATFYVISPGPRPAFAEVARKLWGAVDFDSDGNSANPNDTKWTELTLALRPEGTERVDIDPVSDNPLVLKVESASALLAERAARFLAVRTQGTFSSQWPSA